MNRKYPEVTGWWCYCLIFPDGMFYIGYSGRKCCNRWKKNSYIKRYPFIEQYNWSDIRKVVLKDGLTKEQAKLLEDLLIIEARKGGWCINKERSGGNRRVEWELENPNYNKQYYESHKKEIYLKHKQHRQSNKEKINEWYRQYYKKQRLTPEGRIYDRVKTHNKRHPDQIKETPLEARNKYLEYGYIPSYIKNDDLV